MQLYDLEPSGNCYKVRLFSALAGIDLDLIPVDFMAGEHKQAPVITLNPKGQLPVLKDGDEVVSDSQAILVYIARRYAAEAWYPQSSKAQSEVNYWLSTAANEIQHGPGAARLVDKFGFALDKQQALATADQVLTLLENHLEAQDWLVGDRVTIADCAVMPYVALAPEGGINLGYYPAIQRWISRIKALPGFIPMSGI